MKCAICHNVWNGQGSYCPRCGAPVLPRWRSVPVVPLALVIAALAGFLLFLLLWR